jgi:hypothetical protein
MNRCFTFLAGSTLMFVALISNAQTKIKDGSVAGTPSLPKPGAILDLESNKRALLLPRVELISTTSWAPLNGPVPTEGGYTIYNTSPTTTEGSPAYPVPSEGVGEYYWDGGGWVAKKYNAVTVSQEPFQVESTTTKATINTQNIYQNGNLGLGDFSTSNPLAKLDVRGAVRGGQPHTDELSGVSPIGLFSVAFGGNNKASEYASIALGEQNTASGSTSIAIGVNNVASGIFTTALGSDNTASGQSSTAMGSQVISSGTGSTAMGIGTRAFGGYSTAMGGQTIASGEGSVAMGGNTTAAAYHGTVMGKYNAITTGNAGQDVPDDAFFQVGNGVGDQQRANALTMLKNGKAKIGGYHTTKPELTLEINGTDGLLLPTGTDAQRPASAVFGTLRYNTSIGRAEVYVNDVNGDGTQGDAGWRPI